MCSMMAAASEKGAYGGSDLILNRPAGTVNGTARGVQRLPSAQCTTLGREDVKTF